MLSRYRYRKSHGWVGIVFLMLSIAVPYAEQQGWLNLAGQAAQDNQPGLYAVTRFVDGDTITVDMNGKAEKVRFIGVDTPETKKPDSPVQCYGAAAAAFTKNFISDKRVRLVSDSLSTDRDRYDRILRYVYLTDGTNVNEKLISEGYGFYYPHFPFTKSAEFSAAQESARSNNRGLWGNCQPSPTNGGGYLSNDLD